MKVGDLSFAAAEEALRTDGLVVTFGPFDVRLKIREPALARALHGLYSDYPLADRSGSVVFCELMLVAERRLKSGFRRGFAVYVDGQFHGRSFDLPLALPTLEWTINFAIATSAHRYLMIHSAVVERGGQALLMPGDPGSGKSTLCAALLGRGWRLLSDEFALLRPEDGWLVPMPRPVSLKNRSVELIREASPGLRFGPITRGTPKGDVTHAAPQADCIRRQHELARPRWIVFPTWQAEASGPDLRRLSRAQAFAEITNHAMNYEILGEIGFHAVRRLVEACDAYRFTFNGLGDALTAIEALGDRDQDLSTGASLANAAAT